MPTPAQIKATIDPRMNALIEQLQTKQHSYRAMNGRYWQGLPTHTTIPADGIVVVPDALTNKPTGQAESWIDLSITLPVAFEAALKVDTYDGAQGEGYTITATVKIDGQTFIRVANVGAEKHRARGWRQM